MALFDRSFTEEELPECAKQRCSHRYEKTGSYTRSDGTHAEFFTCKYCGRAFEVKKA